MLAVVSAGWKVIKTCLCLIGIYRCCFWDWSIGNSTAGVQGEHQHDCSSVLLSQCAINTCHLYVVTLADVLISFITYEQFKQAVMLDLDEWNIVSCSAE